MSVRSNNQQTGSTAPCSGDADDSATSFCFPFLLTLQKLFGRGKQNELCSRRASKQQLTRSQHSITPGMEADEAGMQEMVQIKRSIDKLTPDNQEATMSNYVANDSGKDLTRTDLPFSDTLIIFVLGGPGSGKGTQCEKLAKTFQLAHISVGDLLRNEVAQGSALGAEITAAMREGNMVSMSITKQLLMNAIAKERDASIGILLDGFPRELSQAKEFEESIGFCSFLLNFDCPQELLTARLLKRGETSGREDDNAETIAKRLDTFNRLTQPVIDHYARLDRVHTIDSSGTIEEVSARAHQLVKTAIEEYMSRDASINSLDDLGELEDVNMDNEE